MDLIDGFLNLTSTISNWFSILINRITTFSQGVIDALGYVIGIFKAIWYGLTSLLSGLYELIVELFHSNLFSYVAQIFSTISNYIGTVPTVFMSSLLLFIMFRIGVAFVFKILRLNIDYHSLESRNHTWEQHSKR